METDKEAADEAIFQYLNDKENFDLPEKISSPEYDEDEMLRIEKEYTGFYVSGNPLDKHEALMRKFTQTEIATLQVSSKDVTLAGLVTGYKQIKRKKDDALMCKFDLEDLTGVMSAVCFPFAYEKYSEQITEGSVVVLKGNVEVEMDVDGNVMSRQIA